MNFDLISAIELTASAALLIAALSGAFGRDTAGRIRIAAWLGGLVVLLRLLGAHAAATRRDAFASRRGSALGSSSSSSWRRRGPCTTNTDSARPHLVSRWCS